MGLLVVFAENLVATTASSAMAILDVETMVYDVAIDAVGGDVAKAEVVASKAWPIECDNETPAALAGRGANALPFGPGSQACAVAINKTSGFPVSTQATISALLDLRLTRENFRGEALAYTGIAPSQGWNTFAGGATLEGWGPQREGFRAYVDLPPSDGAAAVLTLQSLRLVAENVLANDRAQTTAAFAAGSAVGSHTSGAFTHIIETGATTLLFLAGLMILWRVRRDTTGWRKVIATCALFLLGIGFLAPSSLASLGLEHAQLAGGKGDGLAQILGAPFAVVAQLFDLIRGSILSLGEAATQQRILVATLFLVIVFSERAAVIAMAVYTLLLTPQWFSSGTFSLLPVDLEGYEVAFIVPTIVWVTGIAATVLGVLFVRGLWVTAGERFVAAATRVITPDAP